MRLTDFSLQKLAQSKYKGEIYFSAVEEAGDVLSRKYPFAKALFILSVKTADKFTLFQKLFPTAVITVLLEGDGVQSLFSLPDDVTFVACYGEDYALAAARYFAAVRVLPCAVFAFDASTKALFSKSVSVSFGKEKGSYPAPAVELLFVDETLLDKDGLLTAYVDTVALRVALFEIKFDSLILQTKYDAESYETVAAAVSSCMDTPFRLLERRKIFCAGFLISLCESEGFPFGEVKELAQTYRRLGAGPLAGYYAMEKLAKVYHVFFLHGKYRKYYAPPYHARVRQAAGLYKKREEDVGNGLIVPDVATLAVYSQVFESVRKQFLCDAQELVRRAEWIEDNIEEYKEAFFVDNKLLNAVLKYLPEDNKSYGITSLMRDFGLLDF